MLLLVIIAATHSTITEPALDIALSEMTLTDECRRSRNKAEAKWKQVGFAMTITEHQNACCGVCFMQAWMAERDKHGTNHKTKERLGKRNIS